MPGVNIAGGVADREVGAMLRLDEQFIHLGRGATALPQPAFTGIEWYESYATHHEADGPEGRLVAQHRFTSDWDAWEVHPHGAEVVICTQGRITLIQQAADGGETRITLAPGDYAINPPGVWHTADIAEPATAIFITPGLDTDHRPR